MNPRVPSALAAPALLGAALLVLPLVGLLTKTPWTRLPGLLGREQVQAALWLSLRCSLGALALSLLLGVPLAWVLARSRLPGLRLLRGLVTVPLVLPPVVGGVALLLAFGRRGLFGPLLDDTGTIPAFTPWGVVLAETFVALPFLVLTVEGALSSLDPRHEETAATLGAGPVRVFRTVTLPMLGPSMAAGAALAWARALGEFGATITFAGSLQGRTQTVPLAVNELLVDDPPAAYALSAVLLVVSVAVVVALRARLPR
ncbi:MAG: NifC-like ABC-type porter [Frankiales bacterium]|nr:NifC-like ABC-type porter [Frankiales bacterium]